MLRNHTDYNTWDLVHSFEPEWNECHEGGKEKRNIIRHAALHVPKPRSCLHQVKNEVQDPVFFSRALKLSCSHSKPSQVCSAALPLKWADHLSTTVLANFFPRQKFLLKPKQWLGDEGWQFPFDPLNHVYQIFRSICFLQKIIKLYVYVHIYIHK